MAPCLIQCMKYLNIAFFILFFATHEQTLILPPRKFSLESPLLLCVSFFKLILTSLKLLATAALPQYHKYHAL